MARAGRKRKEGRRDAKGKLRPIIMPDRGNERTAEKREKFGTDGGDAIGRAYRSGLLGEDGQRLMQTARSFHRAYWPMFGIGQVGCTLGDRTGGGGDGSVEGERWVIKTVRKVDSLGRDHRKAFDELVLDFNPDYGPDWLDRHIENQQRPSDADTLGRAIRVLAMLAKIKTEDSDDKATRHPRRGGLFGAARAPETCSEQEANADRGEDFAHAESNA